MNNICFFNSTRFWGGGEKSHYEYAINFREKGYEVCLVTGNNTPLFNRATKLDFKTFNIKISNTSFLNLAKIIKLKNFFRENKIDTVFLNSSADLKIGAIAAKWANVKYIVYMRGLAVPIKNRFLNRLLLTKVVSHIVANSDDTRKTILQNLYPALKKDHVHVIYRGINFNEWDSRKDVDLNLRKGKEIIIGNVGRLVEQKGQAILIDVAKKLQQKGISFKMIIAGEGPLEDELKRLVEKNKMESYIQFTGFLSDVKSFLNSIDIFAFPSLWEGFGFALVEAMAEEKPVVAFNLSSNPYIINNKEIGFLIEHPDTEQFSESIIKLIKDKTLRTSIGKAARKSVVKRFSMDNIIQEWEHLLP